MKKLLLIAATAALTVPGIYAGESKNLELPSFVLMGFSPNGRYAVSYDQTDLVILDLETGETDPFIADDPTYMTQYSGGNGNFIANDGTVVGSSTSNGNAAYFKNGVVYLLDVPDESLINSAHAITPDGSVICGNFGNAKMSIEQTTTMSLPCVWYRNDDGTYGEIVKLPHPTTDFTGRTPQYITAVSISADGKTVVGQVRDFTGFYHEPIVYTRNDNGEWSYKLFAHDLFHKEGMTFPEEPADAPIYPVMENYLSEDEKAAYNAAIDDFFNGIRDTYPDVEDFISQEALEKFNKDDADYQVAYKAWEEAYSAYEAASNAFLDGIPAFNFNSVFISPDGKRLATCTAGSNHGIMFSKKRNANSRADEGIDIGDPGIDDPGIEQPEEESVTPYIFNIETGEYTTCKSDKGIYPSCITDDYTVFGVYNLMDLITFMPAQAVVIPAESDTYMMLEDYIAPFSPEAKNWLTSRMQHDVEVPDLSDPFAEEIEFITLFEFICSGIPTSTPDQSIIGTYTENVWDIDDENYYYSYIVSTGKEAGVSAIPTTDFNVKALEGGIVRIDGTEATVEIFNAAGAKVFSTRAAGDIATNLKGLYIVRATAADGTVKTIKATF